MKKSPYQTEEFKSLEKKWYQKLEATGFRSIEKDDKDGLLSGRCAQVFFQKYKQVWTVQKTAVEVYYRWATSLLNSNCFKNRTHRRIWELHCNGMSKRQIEKAIGHFQRSYKREQIGNIINQIRRENENNSKKIQPGN